VALAVLGTLFGIERGEWDETGTIGNPLAVGGPVGDALAAGAGASAPLFGAVVLLALISVVVRFRRARGVERQQLKWFGWAIGLLLCGLAAAAIGEATGYAPLGNVGWTVFLASLIGAMPLAIAVAILRYRLYDIDRIISRTVAYALVTAILALGFWGAVVVLSTVLAQVAQGASIAVAASTLAAIALFQPVRRRVQHVVDRRFDRANYDAERIQLAFYARLRGEVDMEAVMGDLARTTSVAVAPRSLAIWLRPRGAR
jgi:hypothetical protein